VIFAAFCLCEGGIVPAVGFLAPYASSYNAHSINHAIAAPVFATHPLAARYTSHLATPLAAYTSAAHYPYASPYTALPAPYSYPHLYK
jgi:hypothetical protein